MDLKSPRLSQTSKVNLVDFAGQMYNDVEETRRFTEHWKTRWSPRGIENEKEIPVSHPDALALSSGDCRGHILLGVHQSLNDEPCVWLYGIHSFERIRRFVLVTPDCRLGSLPRYFDSFSEYLALVLVLLRFALGSLGNSFPGIVILFKIL